MRDGRLPSIVLVGQPSLDKQKASPPGVACENIIRKDSRETEDLWEGVKSKALNKSRWGRSIRSCVSLGRLGGAVSR